MGAISSQRKGDDLISTVTVSGQGIVFKVDIGAQSNVPPLKEYEKLKKKPPIESKKFMLKFMEETTCL